MGGEAFLSKYVEKLDFKVDLRELRYCIMEFLEEYHWDKNNQLCLLNTEEFKEGNPYEGIGHLKEPLYGAFGKKEEDFIHFHPRYRDTILGELYRTFPFPISRARLMRVPAKKCYTFHTDGPVNRYHFAIISNNRAFFAFQDTKELEYIPCDGHAYRVNVEPYHTFVNTNSDFDRIHLVLDSRESECSKVNLSPLAKKYYGHQRCKTKYMNHVETEIYAYEFHKKIYNQIKPYLEKGVRSLDIGAGIGVINIFTSEFFDEIHVLDGNVDTKSLSETFYGFHGKGYMINSDYDEVKYDESVISNYCIYNDLTTTYETLMNNNWHDRKVFTHDTNSLKNAPSEYYDFIQSHMSWGWHFPVSTYYNDVLKVLKKGGLLIMDIRDGIPLDNLLSDFDLIDRLDNREENSKKFVLRKK